MIIETKNLILNEYNLSDIDSFYDLKSCVEVWKHSTFIPLNSIDQAKTLLLNVIERRKKDEYTFMALREKKTNVFIGEAGILSINIRANRCEIGYNILPTYWNKGYATEITKSIITYAFDILKIERVEALVVQTNYASCKVLEKSGFTLEGVLRNYNRNGDNYRNVCYYGIISSDFHK